MLNKFILLILLFFSLIGQEPGDSRKRSALVTIPPYRFLIDRIAGDTIKTEVLIPPGANMHTYEPTPKQVMGISNIDIWFRIGEPLEEKVLPSLKNYNHNIKVVDLRDGTDLICIDSGCSHCKQGCDLHFWLSPRTMKSQAKLIAKELTRIFPENETFYQENLEVLEGELDNLDRVIITLLTPLKNRHLFVSHPAYGYFARDYNLTQFSVEFEGKDPTPKQLTRILKKARDLGTTTIFTQAQFSNKGARLVAEEIGAKVVELDPYPENYIQEMRNTAKKISEQ